METCKPVKSPNEKLTAEALAKRRELDVVDPHRISQYRSLAMRAAFLAQDRPDLSETVKCLARKTQGPTEADFGDLKRLARYLKETVRMVQKFTPQKFSDVVSVHADSDFAGCLLTCKSTTGLVCYYGRHSLRHSSNPQSTVSLSSGESVGESCSFWHGNPGVVQELGHQHKAPRLHRLVSSTWNMQPPWTRKVETCPDSISLDSREVGREGVRTVQDRREAEYC